MGMWASRSTKMMQSRTTSHLFDSLVQPITARPSRQGDLKKTPESVHGDDIWPVAISRRGFHTMRIAQVTTPVVRFMYSRLNLGSTVFLHSYAPLLSIVLGEPGRETQPNRVAFYARSLMDREGSKGRLLSPGLSGDDRRSFSVVESIHATNSLIGLFPLSVRPRRKALSTLPCDGGGCGEGRCVVFKCVLTTYLGTLN